MQEIKRKVEVFANVGIILVCGIFCWSYLTHKTLSFHFASSEPLAEAATNEESDRLKGAEISELPGYRWNSHPKTLVLALRSDCPYCEASIPFYRRLYDLEKSGQLHAHLLVILPDEQKTGAKFLQSNGLAVDAVFGQPLNALKVLGTPTVMLLDSTGKVEHEWAGRLSRKGEATVISGAER